MVTVINDNVDYITKL